jgi:hypothetical protein
VGFLGVKDVTVQYYRGNAWYNVPGTFDDTTGLISVPSDTSSMRALKGGMSYQFDSISIGDTPLVLNVPVCTITIIGILAACELGLKQQGEWIYPLGPDVVDAQKVYNVFDNGKGYNVQLTKPGFHPIERTDVYAGQQVNFGSSCFYQITIPTGVSQVKMVSNGTIAQDVNAGQNIQLLCDFLGTLRTAQLSFMYGSKQHDIDILLDESNPFGIIYNGVLTIPFAAVEHLTDNQCLLTITVTEFLSDGSEHKTTRTITIVVNAIGTYSIGPCSTCGRTYGVYVDVKGTDRIRECRIVQHL